MSKQSYDFLNRSGSEDERKLRALRLLFVGNIILLIASTGTALELWYALAHGSGTQEVTNSDLKRDLLIFGPIAVLSGVSLIFFVRYFQKRRR